MTFLHELACSLSELSTEVHKLDNKVRDELPVWETKAFFMLRNLKTDKLGPVQRYLIGEWEPRVSRLDRSLTVDDYARLRKWLGIGSKGIKQEAPVAKANKLKLDKYNAYRVDSVMDLRDTINCGCGCEDYYDNDEDDS